MHEKLIASDIRKLLWEYSVPTILGSLVVAFYNLIDSIYIAYGPGLGEHAIGGLGIVLPVMTLVMAIGSLVGAGAASRISIYLGMNSKETAEKVAGNACTLIVLFTGAFILFMYSFIDPVLYHIGATPASYPYAHEFLIYYLPSCIFFNLSFVLCGIIRASGYPKASMYIMLAGVIANVLLAPVFIFIFHWGMKGAALATGISTIISFSLAVLHFRKPYISLQIYKNNFFPDPKITWSILSIGLSPFIIQFAASVIVFIINNRLRIYGGDLAIEAYTIANRLTLIIILILSGLAQGLQPILGYNWGAEKHDRVKSAMNLAMKTGMYIGAFGMIIGVFFSRWVVNIFNPGEDLASEAVQALQITSITLPLSGIQMVISIFFQSVGMPIKSTLLSLSRQFIFLVPALYLLPHFWGLNGVWKAIPVSDLFSTLLAIAMYSWQKSSFKTHG